MAYFVNTIANKQNSKKRSIFIAFMTTTAMSSLLLAGCANTPTQQEVQTSSTIPVTNEDLTTAKALASILNNSMTPLLLSDKFNQADITCLRQAESAFALQHIQQLLKQYFTPNELQQVNQYYRSALGQKIIQYQQQQVNIAFGEKVTNPITPTPEDIQALQAFVQTPAGKKVQALNGRNSQQILKQLMQPIFIKKAKSCNIDESLFE